jgi:hypothetical protein
VHLLQPFSHLAFGRPGRPDAEERVDGQFVGRRRIRRKENARIARTLQRRLGIRWQAAFIARKSNDRKATPMSQLRRRLEAIAAVVARPASHPDRARMGRNGHREPRHCEARALHQRMGGQGVGRGLFDAARGRDVEQIGGGG